MTNLTKLTNSQVGQVCQLGHADFSGYFFMFMSFECFYSLELCR